MNWLSRAVSFHRLIVPAILLAAAACATGALAQSPPTVQSFAVNTGEAQRSLVRSISIQFSVDVGASLQAQDLNLVNITSNTPVTGHVLAYNDATRTGTWTFPAETGGSLPDGNYNAFIRPADVVGPGSLQLVPNPGATTWFTTFFRYFGDLDGDRDVDFLDTAKFRASHPKNAPDPAYNALADFNSDQKVDDVDLAAFQSRYLSVLSGQTSTPSVINPPERTTERTIVLTGATTPNTRVLISNGFSVFEGLADETGSFSISVGLLANRINSLFVSGEGLTLTDASTLTPITITQDSAPPFVYIDTPADGTSVATPVVTVTGRISDTLSGFDGLVVKVNNVVATITAGIGPNGTFQATDIPLALGENFIVVTGTDALGNTATRSVAVTRIAQSLVEIVSGNDQSAVRNTELPAPVVVLVKDTDGLPFPNKIVNFEVKRSDGHLSLNQGTTSATGPMSAQVRTDAQGLARMFWRVGTDAGNSNNQLSAVSPGLPGEAFFRASADNRPPKQINVGMGNNQVGEAGGLAPLALTAWVSDDLNGCPSVPVTYTIKSGDATLAATRQSEGAQSITVDTDSTGHVDAFLRFGPVGGPVTVEATFTGMLSSPAVFLAKGIIRIPGTPASFSAVVQDNSGLPIGGATCTLNVNGVRLPSVFSDDTGAFVVPNAPPGAGFIQVDGRTANKLGGQIFTPLGRYPSLVYRVTIVPNAVNPLPTTVYLPLLNPVNDRSYDGTQDVELTIQGVDGLKVKIAAASMTLADGTRPSPGTPVTVSLNQVHADNIPMPIQDGVAPLLTWTLQPPGAKFDPPAAIEYPNMTGLPPGSATNFLSYNHDIERFEIVASATVTESGALIKSDRGSGLTSSGWGCNCPPYSATGECEGPWEIDIEKTVAGGNQNLKGIIIKGGSGSFTYKWRVGGAVVASSATWTHPDPPAGKSKVTLEAELEVTDTKKGQKKTKTTNFVTLVELITPNEDPVAAPKDSGDGANEFTYSAAAPGVLTLSLKGKVEGISKFGTVKDKFKFEVGAIAGSTEAWPTGAAGKPTISGDTLTATVTFTTLPVANSEFGKKVAKLLYNGASADENDYEVFFPKADTNHPGAGTGTTPNWYFYWAGTAVPGYDITSGLYSYAVGTATDYAEYNGNPGAPHYTIRGPASAGQETYNTPAAGLAVDRKGIDTLAATLVHEKTHRIVDQNALAGGIWNGKTDTDGDELPDEVEDAMAAQGFDKTKKTTFSPFPYGDDEEVYCEIQAFSARGDATKDWANPGKQSKSKF